MNPIEKCSDCDRWKYKYEQTDFIPTEDLICALCQACFALEKTNEMLEFELKDLLDGGD